MSSWANVEGEEERRTTTIVQSIVENIFLVCIVLCLVHLQAVQTSTEGLSVHL